MSCCFQCLVCTKCLHGVPVLPPWLLNPTTTVMSNNNIGNQNHHHHEPSSSSSSSTSLPSGSSASAGQAEVQQQQPQQEVNTALSIIRTCGHAFHTICVDSWFKKLKYITHCNLDANSSSSADCPSPECRAPFNMVDLNPLHLTQVQSVGDGDDVEQLKAELNDAKKVIDELRNQAQSFVEETERSKRELYDTKKLIHVLTNDKLSLVNEVYALKAIIERSAAQERCSKTNSTTQNDNNDALSSTTTTTTTTTDGDNNEINPSTEPNNSGGLELDPPETLQTNTKRITKKRTLISIPLLGDRPSKIRKTKPKPKRSSTSKKQSKPKKQIKENKIFLTAHNNIQLTARDLYDFFGQDYLTYNVTDFALAEFISNLPTAATVHAAPDRIQLFPMAFYTNFARKAGAAAAAATNLAEPKELIIIPIDRSLLPLPRPNPKCTVVVDCIAIIVFPPEGSPPRPGLVGPALESLSNIKLEVEEVGNGVKKEIQHEPDAETAVTPPPYIVIFEPFSQRTKNYEKVYNNLKDFIRQQVRGGVGQEVEIPILRSMLPKHTDNSCLLIAATEEFITNHLQATIDGDSHSFPPFINHDAWLPNLNVKAKRQEIYDRILSLVRSEAPEKEEWIPTISYSDSESDWEAKDDDEDFIP